MSKTKLGVGYLRVSTKKQAEEGVSLEVQKRDVQKKLEDLKCTKIILFEDEGKSGKFIEGRDDFQKAVSYAIEHDAAYFCTYDTSRFARNTEEALGVVKQLQNAEVELICVTAKFDDTPEGRLIFRMLASIDEYYSDSLGQKIKKSLAKKRAKGYYMGKAPKGYKNIRHDNGDADIMITEDGKIMKQVFTEYIDGQINSLREVASRLDELGFEPDEGKTSFQTASRLLKNPFYAGMFWDKSINDYREHNYEKLISKRDYDYIQEKLSGRSYQKNSYKKIHPDYPLRPIIFCSRCLRKLRGYPARGNGGTYYVYDCPTKGCFRATVTVRVHNEFKQELDSMEVDDDLLRLFSEVLKRNLSTDMEDTVKQSKRLDLRINGLRKTQDTVMNAIGNASNPTVIQNLESRFETLESQIRELEDRKLEIDDELSPAKCEPVIEGGMQYLQNPSSIWENGNINLKTNYQKWIFPEGIEYHPETGLQTRQKCLTYSMIESFQSGDSAMVETAGIEPASKK